MRDEKGALNTDPTGLGFVLHVPHLRDRVPLRFIRFAVVGGAYLRADRIRNCKAARSAGPIPRKSPFLSLSSNGASTHPTLAKTSAGTGPNPSSRTCSRWPCALAQRHPCGDRSSAHGRSGHAAAPLSRSLELSPMARIVTSGKVAILGFCRSASGVLRCASR